MTPSYKGDRIDKRHLPSVLDILQIGWSDMSPSCG